MIIKEKAKRSDNCPQELDRQNMINKIQKCANLETSGPTKVGLYFRMPIITKSRKKGHIAEVIKEMKISTAQYP